MMKSIRFANAAIVATVCVGCSATSPEGATAVDEGQATATVRSAVTGCYWGTGPYVRAGDFNGNSNLDLLSPDGYYVDIFQAVGYSFIFRDSDTLNQWGDPTYTFTGDFNHDGKADLASAYGGNVYMQLSRPDSTGFNIATWPVWNQWGGGAVTFANWPAAYKSGGSGYTFAADFTGDGVTDIASVSGSYAFMKISTSSGFNSQTWPATVSWGQPGYTFAADFTGDGRADIATAYGGSIGLLTSQGSTFTSSASNVTNYWGSADFTFAADFNGDGRADLASAYGGNVYMKLSTGSGFTSQTWPVTNQWAAATG